MLVFIWNFGDCFDNLPMDVIGVVVWMMLGVLSVTWWGACVILDYDWLPWRLSLVGF